MAIALDAITSSLVGIWSSVRQLVRSSGGRSRRCSSPGNHCAGGRRGGRVPSRRGNAAAGFLRTRTLTGPGAVPGACWLRPGCAYPLLSVIECSRGERGMGPLKAAPNTAERTEVRGDAPFGALARVAPVGIVQSDAGGRAVFVNERWCALTGMSAAQAAGVHWLDLIPPADRGRLEQKMSAQGQPEIAFDTRLRRGGGGGGPGPGAGGGVGRGGGPAG